jgi:hypothetical protein
MTPSRRLPIATCHGARRRRMRRAPQAQRPAKLHGSRQPNHDARRPLCAGLQRADRRRRSQSDHRSAALSNQGTDAQYFEPMLRRVVDNCDAVPALTTGDAGYFPPTTSSPPSTWDRAAALRGGPLQRWPTRRVALGLAAPANRPTSRDACAAPHTARTDCLCSSQSDCRTCLWPDPLVSRLRQLSLRGLLRARCEWLLVCATHNLLKLWRAATKSQPLIAATPS